VLVAGAQVTVPGRPEQVLRAVGNLLDNAVKFSPAGSPVEVTVGPDRIEVRDNGPGIDPADLPRVFDRFYRAPAARAVPGSGLGLAIVREIVREWGGTVRAANHPDGGAVVSIGLPPPPAVPDGSRPTAVTGRSNVTEREVPDGGQRRSP
jgi:two-component system sensor histidine kinase MprB